MCLQLDHPADGFMIIKGPESIVRQFFRHYGHPIRSVARESIQIFAALILNFLFPLGMVCLWWMPAGVQTVWLGYQLYVAFAMHAYRYLDGDICCSIQETIGNALLASEGGEVCLHREGDYVLTARLSMS